MYFNICKIKYSVLFKARLKIEDWRKLEQLVREDVDIFKRLWKEGAAERRANSDWASNWWETRKEIDEEVLTPGSLHCISGDW